MSPEDREHEERIGYAFGHLVSSYNVEDPHHSDSGDLGRETLEGIGMPQEQIGLVLILAEHVAGNYRYTGEAEAFRRKVLRGEA